MVQVSHLEATHSAQGIQDLSDSASGDASNSLAQIFRGTNSIPTLTSDSEDEAVRRCRRIRVIQQIPSIPPLPLLGEQPAAPDQPSDRRRLRFVVGEGSVVRAR